MTIKPPKKPEWLRVKVPSDRSSFETIQKIRQNALCTVCVEAQCPNQMECFNRGTATFMLLGPVCTRNCAFCAVEKGRVAAPDPREPFLVAEAISELGLKYCVLTMVTRDDLNDGGAFHIERTVKTIRTKTPEINIELLISDLSGSGGALTKVLQTKPAVLNHNIETVERLYPKVRPQAIYARSLSLLAEVAKTSPSTTTKSGMMLGLGETRKEIIATMSDLRSAGCQVLTMGQYLAPSKKHLPVAKYIDPQEFDAYREEALRLGFVGVASGPLVRSSYRAEELYAQAIRHQEETRENNNLNRKPNCTKMLHISDNAQPFRDASQGVHE